MAKSRKKKYNPNKTAGSVRQRFFENIWISDSSVVYQATVHNADGKGITPLGIPSDMRATWIRELNTSKFPWTFVFFAFDSTAKDFSYAEVPASRPCSSIELIDDINVALQDYLNGFEHGVDAWGWVAVPSHTVDIEANALAWGQYFESIGIYDLDKIERFKTIRILGENQNGLSTSNVDAGH